MKYSLYLALFLTFLVTACSLDTEIRDQTANKIGRPAFMVERFIPAGNFNLNAWERMHERYQPATIYIGDTINSFRDKESIKKAIISTATPKNPVALNLASRDMSANVAFLAQPCQYIKDADAKGCDPRYWHQDKFHESVIASFNNALNEIAARYDINGFHLVGHGDGGNIAALLAATRDDILTLRTVAGNLNPAYTHQYHGAASLPANAMMAADYGSALSNVPQHHYIGAADKIIPPGVYHSYRQMLSLSDCVNYSIIQDADHEAGWVQIWPQLLALKPQCHVQEKSIEVAPPSPYLPAKPDFPGNFEK